MAVNNNPNPNYTPIYLDEGDIITNDYVDQVQDKIKQIVQSVPKIVEITETQPGNTPNNTVNDKYNQIWINKSSEREIQIPELSELEAVECYIANKYTSGKTYTVGDYTIYNNELYKCIHSIPIASAELNSNYWIKINLADDLTNKIHQDLQDRYEFGLNVLQGANYQHGYLNDSGGISGVAAAENYITYQPIKVQPGQKFIITLKTNDAGWIGVGFWDIDQSNFLSRKTLAGSNFITQDDYKFGKLEITVPDKAYFVRISIRTNTWYSATLKRIDSIIGAFQKLNNIAKQYSNNKLYNINSLVFYNNELYKCTVDITAPQNWNSAHWQLVTIDNIFQEIRTILQNIARHATKSEIAVDSNNILIHSLFKEQILQNILDQYATKLNGTITKGSAWRAIGTGVSDDIYCYTRYTNSILASSPECYLVVSGRSWATDYPLICFYDANNNLLASYQNEAKNKIHKNVFIPIPHDTSVAIVNGKTNDQEPVVYFISQTNLSRGLANNVNGFVQMITSDFINNNSDYHYIRNWPNNAIYNIGDNVGDLIYDLPSGMFRYATLVKFNANLNAASKGYTTYYLVNKWGIWTGWDDSSKIIWNRNTFNNIPSTNIYNDYVTVNNTLVSGKAKHMNGSETSGGNYAYIRADVTRGDRLLISGYHFSNTYPLFITYDSENHIIQSAEYGNSGHGREISYDVPNNASYIIVNGFNGPTFHGNGWPSLKKLSGASSLHTSLLEKKKRRYLFVGDSYCEGYSHDGNNDGWATYCADYLGLVQDEWIRAYYGGARFSASNNTYQQRVPLTYPADYFTDVVVCGGYNDNSYTQEQILNGIQSFCDLIKQKYPYATIHIGFIAWNKAGNGAGAISNWKTIHDNLINVVMPAYKKCAMYGATYLNNIEFWINDSLITDSDGYHPSQAGNRSIGQAIAHALLTGDAPLPLTPQEYNNLIGNTALEYSNTKQYVAGECCLYNSQLYRCIVPIDINGEEWNSNHWEETNLGKELDRANMQRTGFVVCGTKPFISNNVSNKYHLVDGFSLIKDHMYTLMIYAHTNLELSGQISIGLAGSNYISLKPGFEKKRILYTFIANNDDTNAFVYLYSKDTTGNNGNITVALYDLTLMEMLNYNYKNDYEFEGAASIANENNTGKYNIVRFNVVTGHHYVVKVWGNEDLSFDGTVKIYFGDSLIYALADKTCADLKTGLITVSKPITTDTACRIYFVGNNVTNASGLIHARIIDVEKLLNAGASLNINQEAVINGTELEWFKGTTENGSYITVRIDTRMTSEHLLLGKGSIITIKSPYLVDTLIYDLNGNYLGRSDYRTIYVMQEDGYVRFVCMADSNFNTITDGIATEIKNNLKIIIKAPQSILRKIMADNAKINKQFGTLLANGKIDLLENALWEVGFLSSAEGIPSSTYNSAGIITSKYLDISTLQGKDILFTYDKWEGHKPTGRIYLYDNEKTLTRYVTQASEGTINITIRDNECYARALLTDNWTGTTFSNTNISNYTGFTHLYVQLSSTKSDINDDFDDIYKDAIMTTRKKFVAKAEAGRLGYGFLTDLHLNARRSESNLAQRRQYRALIDTAKMSGMDFVVLGGDIIDAESNVADAYQLVEEMITYADASNVKLIILTGNHDDNCYGALQTKSWLRSFLIDRITVPAVFPDDKACYYYVDVPNKNWRAVCLDCIDYDEYNRENNGSKKGSNWWSLSRSQVKWFCETALNTSKNIALFTHMSPDKTRNSYNLGDEGGFHTDLINAIIAYNARSSITLYGTTYNFNTATGTVKLMHTGHSHIEYTEDYVVAGIPCLNTGCGKQFSQSIGESETRYGNGDNYTYELNETAAQAWHRNGYGYIYRHYVPRDIGTLNQALIDVVSVNTDNIYVFRLGIGNDRIYSWDIE